MGRTTRGGKELLTLTEVGRRTGISMPTLLRYKRQHQERIPTVGEGRRQRYPEAALVAFQAIKRENLRHRGRRSAPTGGASATKLRRDDRETRAPARPSVRQPQREELGRRLGELEGRLVRLTEELRRVTALLSSRLETRLRWG